MILWQLFISYLKIGFFGFGGGYAMLSLIQNEVVVQHQWMTAAEFADIVAVSQITPTWVTASASRPDTPGAASWVRQSPLSPSACRR